jgi:hypothetical protein
MTKNGKIALGCGGVGCVGLIVLALVGGGYAYWRYSTTKSNRVYERNSNYSFNSNSNGSSSNSNHNENSEATSSPSTSSSTSSSFSDDDKHKLFQAVGMTKDQELIVKVMKRIGLFKADNTPADGYAQFVKDHLSWAMSNSAFVESVTDPDKARAYVNERLPDL